jgi:hypothetical protein
MECGCLISRRRRASRAHIGLALCREQVAWTASSEDGWEEAGLGWRSGDAAAATSMNATGHSAGDTEASTKA